MAADFNVAQFHADYDAHKDHRIRLFSSIVDVVEALVVLYPGSYVDIAPSVVFPEVYYVDTDKRAARFFRQADAVTELIDDKRRAAGLKGKARFRFHHIDYTGRFDFAEEKADLLISLYAGFISSHCTRYLKPGGHLFVNNSHGDASMASLNANLRLVGVVDGKSGGYRYSDTNLDAYLVPKRGNVPTVDELRALGRGIAYTKSPYAYLFRRDA